MREVARIATGRWWRPWRLVRRIVTGYVKECPKCGVHFIVTQAGTDRLTPEAQDLPAEEVAQRPRVKRTPKAEWLEKPGT